MSAALMYCENKFKKSLRVTGANLLINREN